MRMSSHWLKYGYITFVTLNFSQHNNLIWHIRLLCCKKVIWHWLQYYDFSPMCILIWLMRSIFSAKALSQYLHWYGFSVLCVLVCSISSPYIENAYYTEYIDMASPQCDSRYVCEGLSFVKEVIIAWETLVTLVTMIWFLHRVYSHIVYKITIIWEIYVTLVTISYGL